MRQTPSTTQVVLATALAASAAALPARGFETETSKVFTEDAPPVDPGRTEVQLAYDDGTSDEFFDDREDRRPAPDLGVRRLILAVTRGLRPGLDLSGTLSWSDVVVDEGGELSGNHGVLQANAKWMIYSAESAGVSVSWLPGLVSPVTNPTGTAPGQEFWSLDNLFAVTWVPGRFNLSADAGLALAIGSERAGELWSAVADVGAGYQVTSWFQPVLSLNLAYTEFTGSRDGRSVGGSVGAVFNLPRGFRIDLGVQQTLRGRNVRDRRIALLNVSWTF